MPRLSKIGAAALAAFGWTGGASVSADFLVIAGGGGGGRGGGGAGGYRTSAGTSGGGASAEGRLSLNPTLSYAVTVGAGGTGAPTYTTKGSDGNDSVFFTITSTKGGGGGGGDTAVTTGSNGGSGGGGGAFISGTSFSGGTGTANQGYAGGTGRVTTSNGAGGGGGAGSVGANGTTPVESGGNGGSGVASSISGSSVTYAGGGGGGAGGASGVGGTASGGGGAGANTGGSATAATANTGGGGGGGPGNGAIAGANGGSGVVIISYPAPQKFGGGVVTTSGSNVIHTFNTSGTLTPLSSLTASYLIVAGGGAGGVNQGGGGGAGGLLTGSGLTIDTNSNYVVVVGAGATQTGNNATTANGGNSSFSMVTTTALGGGGAGGYTTAGASGGSGGGGGGANGSASSYAGGSGTSGQGYAGGTGTQIGVYTAGGGGGASAAGANSTITAGGNGGAGTASSISGTSVTYAGGGGGGVYAPAGQTPGSGGAGGGGTGGGTTGAVAGTNGTANLGGGGGGGAGSGGLGGNGGSGVVIISYAGSTQQMAGGTVTISGGNVIHTFTSSGYLTPIKYVNNSLRFRSSASAYLNRTFSTPTNSKTWTWNGWVKIGSGGFVNNQTLFGAGSYSYIYLNDGTNPTLRLNSSGTSSFDIATSQYFRDPAAWYMITVAFDSTQATASNRVKMYVNGIQVTSFAYATYPALNDSTYINTAIAHSIGARVVTSSLYFDGYLTEVNFIDGQALTPNSFGTFNSYGVWQPITYGGSYGTNGFYLPFTNKTSTTTLGYDFSPNGNNWTTNNISLTAGSTYDSMTDVPTLTSATAANYAVLNPNNVSGSGVSLTNGNLSISIAAAATCAISTIAVTSGKWYWEFTAGSASQNAYYVSVCDVNNWNAPSKSQTDMYNSTYVWTYYGNNGNKITNATATAYGSSFTSGDVIGVALDMDAGTIVFYKNNTSQGTAFSVFAGKTIAPMIGNGASTTSIAGSINFGQQPFTYTPPTGFLALNTYNL